MAVEAERLCMGQDSISKQVAGTCQGTGQAHVYLTSAAAPPTALRDWATALIDHIPATPAQNTPPLVMLAVTPISMLLLWLVLCRYLSYIQDKPKKGDPLYAVLRDASGSILSVSPVINAEPCKIAADSTNVLIEVSGTESLELVQQVATEFLERFAKAYKAEYNGKEGSEGGMLQVAPVRLLTPLTGHVRLIWPPKA